MIEQRHRDGTCGGDAPIARDIDNPPQPCPYCVTIARANLPYGDTRRQALAERRNRDLYDGPVNAHIADEPTP